jgi:hypothetical protein
MALTAAPNERCFASSVSIATKRQTKPSLGSREGIRCLARTAENRFITSRAKMAF